MVEERKGLQVKQWYRNGYSCPNPESRCKQGAPSPMTHQNRMGVSSADSGEPPLDYPAPRLREGGDLQQLVRCPRPLQKASEREVPGRTRDRALVVRQLDSRYLREWVVLGRRDVVAELLPHHREHELDGRVERLVGQLWGDPRLQQADQHLPDALYRRFVLQDPRHGLDEEVLHQQWVDEERKAVHELERRDRPTAGGVLPQGLEELVSYRAPELCEQDLVAPTRLAVDDYQLRVVDDEDALRDEVPAEPELEFWRRERELGHGLRQRGDDPHLRVMPARALHLLDALLYEMESPVVDDALDLLLGLQYRLLEPHEEALRPEREISLLGHVAWVDVLLPHLLEREHRLPQGPHLSLPLHQYRLEDLGGLRFELGRLPPLDLPQKALPRELLRHLVDLGPWDARRVLYLVDRARSVGEEGVVDSGLVLSQAEPLKSDDELAGVVGQAHAPRSVIHCQPIHRGDRLSGDIRHKKTGHL